MTVYNFVGYCKLQVIITDWLQEIYESIV